MVEHLVENLDPTYPPPAIQEICRATHYILSRLCALTIKCGVNDVYQWFKDGGAKGVKNRYLNINQTNNWEGFTSYFTIEREFIRNQD